MMDAIKTLTIIGAQSHAHTVLNFNRYGVHRISAEGSSNSHGKSVIMKIIYALNGEYLDKESRLAIIRDDSEYCIGSLESFNGYRLSVAIHEEKSKCFYMLQYKDQAIKKTLSDDYKELIKVLNFHKTEEFDYSLNIYKTKTTLPFTHFSGTQNEKILVSASEIPNYRKMLEILDENIKTVESDLVLNKARISSCESNLNMIRYNYTQEDVSNFNIYDRFVKDYQVLKELFNPLTESIKIKHELNELNNKKVVNAELANDALSLLSKLHEVKKLLDGSLTELTTLEELKSKTIKYENLTTGLTILKGLTTTKIALAEVLESEQDLESKKKFNPKINTAILSNIVTLSLSLTEIKQAKWFKKQNKTFVPVTSNTPLKNIGALLESIKTLSEIKSNEPVPVRETLDLNTSLLPKLNNLRTSIISVQELNTIKPREVSKTTQLDLTIMSNLKQVKEQVTWVSNSLKSVEQLRVEEVKVNADILKNIESLFVRTQSALTTLESLNNTQTKLSELKEELISLTEQLGICPTCGGELNIERILEHEH